RPCLDAVGILSEDFDRGYLEDVDFCLRARQLGFRNVCAPSVYVGHAGSKSFGAEKRSLVVRNTDVLRCRYPTYCFEFGAFDLADPLRPCREAIERHAYPATKRPRLLITGAGAVGAIARERGRNLAAKGQSVLIFEVRHRAGGPRVMITDPAGGVPQSIAFDLSSRADCDSLKAFGHSVRPSRIEILDPANVPFGLVDVLIELKTPFDLVIADAGLLGRHGAATLLAATRSVGSHRDVGARPGGRATPPPAPDEKAWVARWRDIADAADMILTPDEQGTAFAAGLLNGRRICQLEGPSHGRPAPRRDKKAAGWRLGLLPVRPCAEEKYLMSEVARAFGDARPDLALTVIGATLDDVGLMRIGNTHVTGPVDGSELGHVADSYGLDVLFASVTRPLFGHPLLEAASRTSRPLAYFDWSRGSVAPRTGDLPLDPGLSLQAIVTELDRWMPQARQGP
ncbi:MAG TPA: hypothetical protein VK281_19085, partial [Xanthobacteraceae bacterium]|nr:hypothetical protein [Xanthobacteraceae bacterium]